jgi:hypothetical protein
MFPHLTERIIMATANDLKTSQSGHVFDNRAVINALDKTAIMVRHEMLITADLMH